MTTSDIRAQRADYDRLPHLLGIDRRPEPATAGRDIDGQAASRHRPDTATDDHRDQVGQRPADPEPHEIIDNRDGGLNVFVPRPAEAQRSGGPATDDRRRSPSSTSAPPKRIRERRTTPQGSYLFGSPADPTGFVGSPQLHEGDRALLPEMAETLQG